MTKHKHVDELSKARLAKAFPPVAQEIVPLGSRVLVQIRTPKSKTSGGIILTAETRETDQWNTQIGKVIAVGPLAFHNRNEMKPWPEGAWCKPGDFVRVSKYGGDRFSVPTGNADGDEAIFVVLNDLDLIALVTGDPLAIKAFI